MTKVSDEIETKKALDAISELSPDGYCVAINFLKTDVDFVKIDYDLEWLNHYASENLLLDDPTVTFAREKTGHITWDKLREEYPDTKTLFESRKFGIDKGNTISVEVDGIKSLLSGAGRNWTPDEVRKARSMLLTIHGLYAKYRDS